MFSVSISKISQVLKQEIWMFNVGRFHTFFQKAHSKLNGFALENKHLSDSLSPGCFFKFVISAQSFIFYFYSKKETPRLMKKNKTSAVHWTGASWKTQTVFKVSCKSMDTMLPPTNQIHCSKWKKLRNVDLHQTSSSFVDFIRLQLLPLEVWAHFIHCAQRWDTPYTLLLEFTLCRAARSTTKICLCTANLLCQIQLGED